MIKDGDTMQLTKKILSLALVLAMLAACLLWHTLFPEKYPL